MSSTLSPDNTSVAHWDRIWHEKPPVVIDSAAERLGAGPVKGCFFDQMGNVEGKHVLDLGCGDGHLSVWLAKQGARVTAVDNAAEAIEATRRLAQYNQVSAQIETRVINAQDLAELGQEFDLAVGQFILHHIEPFDDFCDLLVQMLTGDGRGVFLENNGRNPILMFCRRFLAGRFGIPRYGDLDEYPFEPRELAMLEQRFGGTKAIFPQLIFLRKLNTYLFRHKPIFRPLCRLLDLSDNLLYRVAPGIRKWSYQQVVTISSADQSP